MSRSGENNLISRRYSKVLLLLSQEQKKESEVSADLKKISDLMESDSDRWRVVVSPAFSEKKQLGVVDLLSDSLKLSKLTSNFLKVLVERGRLSLLADIVSDYNGMAEESHGILKALIKSSHVMSKDEVDAVIDVLKQKTKKEIRVEQVADPKIIGGLQIYLGSVLIDTSLKTRIDKMRQAMKG